MSKTKRGISFSKETVHRLETYQRLGENFSDAVNRYVTACTPLDSTLLKKFIRAFIEYQNSPKKGLKIYMEDEERTRHDELLEQIEEEMKQ